ncbi:MAG: DUF6702 family protein [Bacteroidota bacterium]
MMKFKKIILILTVLPLFAFTLHKYYISLTKIDYIQEKESVQITMRFFIDDVEKTINNRFNKSFELATENELSEANKFIALYINQKFNIKINNQVKTYQYLGKEYENDVVYFYLEITDIENIKALEVQNRMLFEEFEEQQNYIKLNIYNQQKTFILIKDNDKDLLKF